MYYSRHYIDHNFSARYLNGNIPKGIKICHWNKGGGFLCNKIEEIESLIEKERPHILGISEATLKSTDNEAEIQIQNYNVFHASTLINPKLNTSRLSVYVHKDLNVKVRMDLMNNTFSSIWLEVGQARQKKIDEAKKMKPVSNLDLEKMTKEEQLRQNQ